METSKEVRIKHVAFFHPYSIMTHTLPEKTIMIDPEDDVNAIQTKISAIYGGIISERAIVVFKFPTWKDKYFINCKPFIYSIPDTMSFCYDDSGAINLLPLEERDVYDEAKLICSQCRINKISTFFGCGHRICYPCAYEVNGCPLCGKDITATHTVEMDGTHIKHIEK